MAPWLKPLLTALLLVCWGGVALAQADSRTLKLGTAPEKRIALVIGNSAYAQGPLRNPVNDARAIATRLRTLGFEVILRENLKTREIGSVYREFRTRIVAGGTALVFYAGHGLQAFTNLQAGSAGLAINKYFFHFNAAKAAPQSGAN